MAISLNWINDYVDIASEDKVLLANKVTKAGINVEKVSVNNINNNILFNIVFMLLDYEVYWWLPEECFKIY